MVDNLELLTIWKAERSRGQHIRSHTHDYHELVYYLTGSGTTQVGSEQSAFTPGSYIIIGSGVSHSELHSSGGEVLCMGFSADTPLPQVLRADPTGLILSTLRELLQETLTQGYGYREMIDAKLRQLHIQVQRCQTQVSHGTRNFEYIIRYLAENYHEKIRLSDCAAQLNISYDYFQHKFKELTGDSPQAFLLRHRLQAARLFLEQGSLSCTQIAFRCGFSTSAQFSMLFKKALRVTPMQYRKVWRQGKKTL